MATASHSSRMSCISFVRRPDRNLDDLTTSTKVICIKHLKILSVLVLQLNTQSVLMLTEVNDFNGQ